MTADAKVGLLLGLFFIVVIAFLINGLPNFIQKDTPEEKAATALVVPSGPDLVIDRRITETAQRLSPGIPLRVTEPPKDVFVLSQAMPASPFPAVAETPFAAPPQLPQAVEQQINRPVAVVEPAPALAPTAKPAAARAGSTSHVVQKGETLAVIAKKYYGPEEGNRRAVIQKLYEANKDVLASPDKVTIGNKLVIPAMAGTQTPSASETLLKKFTNMFEKPSDQPKALRPVPAPTSVLSRGSTKEYVVQPGDNLWKIAEKTMGDGKQFNKLVELNKNRLKSADDLMVGMKLVVPAH